MPAPATIAEVAAAIRVDPTDSRLVKLAGDLEGYYVARVRGAAIPAGVARQAYIRLVGYVFDSPEAGPGSSWANAWQNSGAAALVAPFLPHRAGALPQDGPARAVAPSAPSGVTPDGSITLAKLAAAVVARLLPTGIANGKFLRKTADGWIGADAGGAGAPADGSITLAKLAATVAGRLLPAGWVAGNVARKADLTITDSALVSTDSQDWLGDRDGQFQFFGSDGRIAPNGTIADVVSLRIGRKQWPSAGDWFSEDTRDYGTLLHGIGNGDVISFAPYDPETQLPGEAVLTFTASGPSVLTDESNDDEDYYTIPGTLAGDPTANNGDMLWRLVFAESVVEVLGADVVDPIGIVRGTQLGSPESLIVRDGSLLSEWSVADAEAHLLGPDTRKLLVLSPRRLANGTLPAVGTRISFNAQPIMDGAYVTMNVTWGTNQQDKHLALFLKPGARFAFGTAVFRVHEAGVVNRNTVAYGGYGTTVQWIGGALPAVGHQQGFYALGRVVHYTDPDSGLLPDWDVDADRGKLVRRKTDGDGVEYSELAITAGMLENGIVSSLKLTAGVVARLLTINVNADRGKFLRRKVGQDGVEFVDAPAPADGTITTAKLANLSVTLGKLAAAVAARLLPTGIATGKFLKKTATGWEGADPGGGGGGITWTKVGVLTRDGLLKRAQANVNDQASVFSVFTADANNPLTNVTMSVGTGLTMRLSELKGYPFIRISGSDSTSGQADNIDYRAVIGTGQEVAKAGKGAVDPASGCYWYAKASVLDAASDDYRINLLGNGGTGGGATNIAGWQWALIEVGQ